MDSLWFSPWPFKARSLEVTNNQQNGVKVHRSTSPAEMPGPTKQNPQKMFDYRQLFFWQMSKEHNKFNVLSPIYDPEVS